LSLFESCSIGSAALVLNAGQIGSGGANDELWGFSMRELAVILIGILLSGPVAATQDVLKDPGGKTIAVILDCSECKDQKKGSKCASGVESGFEHNAPCGQCLLDANFGTRIGYAYDLVFTGYLKDEKGEPVKGKFVKLFLPNTWTVRTRTTDKGMFRLLLGATVERKGNPVQLDLGVRTMRPDRKADFYALYMLPEGYKPCGAAKK